MGISIRILASGSSANAALIRAGGTSILLDAGGMSWRTLHERLLEAGTGPEAIGALLVSHTHADHIGPAGTTLSRRYGVPIYTHRSNVPHLKSRSTTVIGFDEKSFTLASSTCVLPFPVPHDADGVTCGFSIFSGGRKLTVATDLGHFEEGLELTFKNSNLIMLEANHDEALLDSCCKLPQVTKERIASAVGHLSNDQAAQALTRILNVSETRPSLILLAHLSADRNSPHLALETVRGALEKSGYSKVPVEIASRNGDPRTFTIGRARDLTLL